MPRVISSSLGAAALTRTRLSVERFSVTFISDEQIRRNRDSRSGWDLYAGHRENVTFLLTQGTLPANARLCILGAGNCNDFDLRVLRSHFHQIHLIDLDEEALLTGCQAQGLDSDPQIICQGNVDVTGILSLLSGWRPEAAIPPAEVEAAIQCALRRDVPGLEWGAFDVVASTGLLTQLIDSVGLTLGPRHPRYLELVTNVRLRHLRMLMELLRPGGRSWLFTEIVSSLTCPELSRVSNAELLPLLNRCIQQGNFFSGCNPAVVPQVYQRDAELQRSVRSLTTTRPWLWNFIYRTYAVCGFGAVKNESAG